MSSQKWPESLLSPSLPQLLSGNASALRNTKHAIVSRKTKRKERLADETKSPNSNNQKALQSQFRLNKYEGKSKVSKTIALLLSATQA